MEKCSQAGTRDHASSNNLSAVRLPSPSAKLSSQPENKLTRLQSQHTNQSIQRLLQHRVLQAKLTINQPGDAYEQEADRVADAVMRMPDPGHLSSSESSHSTQRGSEGSVHLQRMCSQCEEEQGHVQAKHKSTSSPDLSPEVDTQIRNLHGHGTPLAGGVRTFFESRMGRDFSGVRVHTGNHASETARQVSALAYTTGPDIVFGGGQYQPDTAKGRRLIAHELAHVVQQGGSPPLPPVAPNFAGTPQFRAASGGTSPQVQRIGDPRQKPASMTCPIATTSSDKPILTSIMFDKSGVTLSPGAIAELGAVAAEWNAVPLRQARIRIDGYASTDGPQGLNWTLSCNRANVVAAELESPSGGGTGIPASFFDIFAQGQTDEFSADLPPNRRATVRASLPVPVLPATGCVTPGDARRLDVQPVFLRTSPADHSPTGFTWAQRFSEANRIWGKLGVVFNELTAVTMDTPLKTTGGTPAERTAIRALRSGDGVEVFVVANDVADQGGAETALGCGPAGKVIMTDHGTSDTLLAHELGHTLGIRHPGDPVNPGDANTVMQPTGSPSIPNSTRNTIANYNRILCPPGTASTCLHPDP